MRTSLLALYGAVLGGVFVLAMMGLDRAAFVEPDIAAGFILAATGAAVFAGRVAPRVPSSLRLIGIAAALGVAVAVSAAARPRGPELALVLALVGPPLVALRLALDLFAPRHAPFVRRLWASLACPVLVFAVITGVHLSEGRMRPMTASDREFIVILALLGPAIVPPRQLESEPRT